MKIERVRTKMRKRFEAIDPSLAPDVILNNKFDSDYLLSFRARNMRTLEKHENKTKVLFCRSCLNKDERGDWLICYRTCCSLEDNLVENKQDSLIRLQCFNCDFDLYFPYVDLDPHITATEVRMREQIMAQQAAAGAVGGGSMVAGVAEVAYRKMIENEIRRADIERMQNVVAPPPIPDPAQAGWRSLVGK